MSGQLESDATEVLRQFRESYCTPNGCRGCVDLGGLGKPSECFAFREFVMKFTKTMTNDRRISV